MMSLIKTITNALNHLLSFLSPAISKTNNQATPVQIYNLTLTPNQLSQPADIVIAQNEYSIIAAFNFAKQKNSHFIADLSKITHYQQIDQTNYIEALKAAKLIFAGNRMIAKKLENKLQRHINISRHTSEILPADKYIDLKKVYHLIDDVQIIIFDSQNDSLPQDQHQHNLQKQFEFLAHLLQKLPRQTHIIVTGSKQESLYFNAFSQNFEQLGATSRIHFYTENLASIKYPINYSNVDLAIIIEQDENYIPNQYYKFLHEEVAIFSTQFAESNQLIASAKIGKTFENLEVKDWAASIKKFLNSSENDRNQYLLNLIDQKSKINWQKEADHFISSIVNNIEQPIDEETSIYIIDLSENKISNRTDNICNILNQTNPIINVVTPKLPIIHTPMTNGVNYIKISNKF